jgi:hypothetical protein
VPRGPKGEKRPADVIGAAVMVGRIAIQISTIDEQIGNIGGLTLAAFMGGERSALI